MLEFTTWGGLRWIELKGCSVFRILWGNTRGGSIPPFRTNDFKHLVISTIFASSTHQSVHGYPEEAAFPTQELLVTNLAQTDAVAKLLIEKGVITQDEFMEKIKAERATYQAMLQNGHISGGQLAKNSMALWSRANFRHARQMDWQIYLQVRCKEWFFIRNNPDYYD